MVEPVKIPAMQISFGKRWERERRKLFNFQVINLVTHGDKLHNIECYVLDIGNITRTKVDYYPEGIEK